MKVLVMRRYNMPVGAATPKKQPDRIPPERHPIPEVYTVETTGLLVIAAIVLILTLVRYWHHIPWGAR
jgi:hypothetical protein